MDQGQRRFWRQGCEDFLQKRKNIERRMEDKKRRNSVCQDEKREKVFPRKTLEVRLSDRADIGEGE